MFQISNALLRHYSLPSNRTGCTLDMYLYNVRVVACPQSNYFLNKFGLLLPIMAGDNLDGHIGLVQHAAVHLTIPTCRCNTWTHVHEFALTRSTALQAKNGCWQATLHASYAFRRCLSAASAFASPQMRMGILVHAEGTACMACYLQKCV